MAAMVLAVLLLEQKHCDLHERMVELYRFQFECWFIPPSLLLGLGFRASASGLRISGSRGRGFKGHGKLKETLSHPTKAQVKPQPPHVKPQPP